MSSIRNDYPKLHNAMWPGLVGKGSPGAEPAIDLETMLNLTAAAEVKGVKFDGVDIFLYAPHIPIDISDDDLKRLADNILAKKLVVGSVVAPIWPPTGGGSAMGSAEERKAFVEQVRKGCRIAARLREFGARPHGVVRIDSACSPADWAKDPEGNTKLIAQTFAEACDVAEGFGERLAAEGEICWGGLHSWKAALKLLETVNRPKTLGFQADMAHTLLYLLGYNAPQDRLLPQDFTWDQTDKFQEAYKTLTAALRRWTTDFHVAQNDATVKGSGTHDKTGRHCLPDDPDGKLNIVREATQWLCDEKGAPTKAVQHLCWDGCMFANEVMMKPETWNGILATMTAVRDACGWVEEAAPPAAPAVKPIEVAAPPKPAAAVPARPVAKKLVKKAPKKAAKKPVKPAPKKAPRKAAKAAPKKLAKAAAKKPAKPARKKAAKLAPKKVVKPARKKAAKKPVKKK
jgi:sugar phosphate isomerase/epimerase